MPSFGAGWQDRERLSTLEQFKILFLLIIILNLGAVEVKPRG